MTHEFKNLIQGYQNAKHIGLKTVIATVVALDGSSYRRPGVRMLINENGHMTGAVSGGCVEKEILKQSGSVFKTGKPKMMSYDGRYRLGCEGVLYILIEAFDPNEEMMHCFQNSLSNREPFTIQVFYSKEIGIDGSWGSIISFIGKNQFSFAKNNKLELDKNTKSEVFVQQMKPCFKLIIVGAEHDAAQLCLLASSLGWDVVVVANASDPQTITDFPGAVEIMHKSPEAIEFNAINENVAVVLMTHSYVKDLQYLLTLKDTRPVYLGLLGPSNRREKILNDLIERFPLINDSLFDVIYGPAGLNIGAETPQEIALSICSEILAVIRNQEPKSLKDKTGKIHLNISL
jgi:xanthine/CO dehydrogenase XdhC/CoxF family maturation factor